MKELILATGIFKGFNDQHGLMLCGYEWGYNKADQEFFASGEKHDLSKPCTYSNKSMRYGDVAWTWRYDQRIKKWFATWGHPLNEGGVDGFGDDFDKSITQTNWSNDCGTEVEDYDKFLADEHVDNFLFHIEELKPKVLIFMGSKLIDYLQNEKVKSRFMDIVGPEVEGKTMVQKPFSGTQFKVYFQKFENCQVICFPHPSGTIGLSDEYIKLFQEEMERILSQYKKERHFN